MAVKCKWENHSRDKLNNKRNVAHDQFNAIKLIASLMNFGLTCQLRSVRFNVIYNGYDGVKSRYVYFILTNPYRTRHARMLTYDNNYEFIV